MFFVAHHHLKGLGSIDSITRRIGDFLWLGSRQAFDEALTHQAALCKTPDGIKSDPRYRTAVANDIGNHRNQRNGMFGEIHNRVLNIGG